MPDPKQIDLSDFDDAEIEAEVESRGLFDLSNWATDDLVAELDRREWDTGYLPDGDAYGRALDALRRGDRSEARIMLERALGHEWGGVLTQK